MSGRANSSTIVGRGARGFATIVFGTLLLLASLAWSGQPATELTFQGRVVDDATGAPLAGVQVYLSGAGVGALTDTLGWYSFRAPRRAVAVGRTELVAELIGYAAARTTFVVGQDGVVETDLRLRAGATALGEVTVNAERQPVDAARVARPATPVRDASGAAPPRPAPGSVPTTFSSSQHRRAAAGLRRARAMDPDWNREQYAHIDENDFRTVAAEPLSTFSIDVDRASYSNVRRFLREGRLPPVDAVQIEEMINYFPYRYRLPEGDDPVAVTTELGRAPWRSNHRLLRIGLASRPIDTADLPPANLVFLLDVSGSMQSPDKLPLVKRSLRLLVDQLRPQDRVAIVVYAGAAGLVLESTPGSHRESILEAIERLQAGGSTAGGAGLRLAYRIARDNFVEDGNNRVILATDGDFNVGPSSDSEMVRLIESKRDQGTFLTVLGFGTGNLQSAKMQSLAQHGNGNYAYIDTLAEARKVFVSELGGTLLTVAKDVKLQVEFNPARVRAYRLIGYENRLLANEDFNNDAKDAGELGAGHRVTALYEIIPTGVDTEVELPTVDPLRYQHDGDPMETASRGEIAFVRLRYKQPDGDTSRLLEHPVPAEMERPSADFHFATAVAGFGMLLRESEHRGSVTVAQVLGLARRGLDYDPDGYRRQFLRMVERYRELAGRAIPL